MRVIGVCAGERARGLAARVRRTALAGVGTVVLLAGGPVQQAAAVAPSVDPITSPRVQQTRESVGCPNGGAPDVRLDVSQLTLEQVRIVIERLRARVNLDARLGSLLTLTAGVDASADTITVEIGRADARLELTVCLGTVEQIIDRTLTTIDRNPQILSDLLSRVTGLLSQTVNQLGQTVLRTVDAAGNIVERTLDSGANVLSENPVGNISSLPVLGETTDAAGQRVRRLQDPSGSVIEVVLDAAGQVTNTRVVNQALPAGR